MNQRIYEQLKRKFAAERQASIDAAEATYKTSIEALELIWSRLNGGQVAQPMAQHVAQPQLPTQATNSSGPYPTRGYVTGLRSAIRRAWVGLEGDFNADPIVEKVQAEFPDVERRAVTDALFRMAQDKELIPVEPGKGRRKAVYRVPKQGQENLTQVVDDERDIPSEGLPM